MASQPIILDYHQNYFVPCQLRLIQAGTFYQFNFCQCVQRVRTIPCDGTEKLSVGEECAHWDNYEDAVTPAGVLSHGDRAVSFMRSLLDYSVLPIQVQGFLKLRPTLAWQNCDTCLYGISPDTIITKGAYLLGNLYFQRCNGLFVNDTGDSLESHYPSGWTPSDDTFDTVREGSLYRNLSTTNPKNKRGKWKHSKEGLPMAEEVYHVYYKQTVLADLGE